MFLSSILNIVPTTKTKLVFCSGLDSTTAFNLILVFMTTHIFGNMLKTVYVLPLPTTTKELQYVNHHSLYLSCM